MKITAQEEYGLRILVRIARQAESDGLAIPEISQAEGLSTHNVAKLCRILRLAGLIKSTRGQAGGYSLARPAGQIRLQEVLEALGGRLFDEAFCEGHSGVLNLCTHSVDCTVKSLWQVLQQAVDNVLDRLTLGDLLQGQAPEQQPVRLQSIEQLSKN